LGEGLDGVRMDPAGGPGAGGDDVVLVAVKRTRETLGHLAAGRIAGTEEQHLLLHVGLWRDALDDPVLRFAQTIGEAIVQTVVPALPELEHDRDDAIAAPMRRSRDGEVA